MPPEISTRLAFAKTLVEIAGKEALVYFNQLDKLNIEQKGHQDLVSDADKNVELLIRDAIDKAFLEDGIVGEEHDSVATSSGYTWVVDPIDGTANFVRGIQAWTVVLACVHEDEVKIGVIGDPVHEEIYSAAAGEGAYLNNEPMSVASTKGLHDGSVGIGYSNRSGMEPILQFLTLLAKERGVFIRVASGALSLAYVACGRVNGFVEEHMNAWDCLAGQLLIKEAGGKIEHQSADDMLVNGGRVITATPAIFDKLVEMADEAFRKE